MTGKLVNAWIRWPILAVVLVPPLSPVAQAVGDAERREAGGSGNVVTDWSAIAQNAIVTVGAQPIHDRRGIPHLE